MKDGFNRNFEGDIKFGHGFEAAVKSYDSLSWLDRLMKKPLGYVRMDYTAQRCDVDYKD